MSRQKCVVFRNLATAFTKPAATDEAGSGKQQKKKKKPLKKWKSDLLITFANASSSLEEVRSKIECCPLLKQEERIILREADSICWALFSMKENLSKILITFEKNGQTFNKRFIDWSVVEDGQLFHFWLFVFYGFYPEVWSKEELRYRVNVLEWFYTTLVFTDEMWCLMKLNALADPRDTVSPQSISIAYQKRGLIISSNLPNNRLGLRDVCDNDDFATIHWNNSVHFGFYLHHLTTSWCWMDYKGERHSHCTEEDDVDVVRPKNRPRRSQRINGNVGRHQVEKWQRISSPPVYFERVETDADICGGAASPYSFLRQAAHLGLVEPIQKVISRFEALRRQGNHCVIRTYKHRGGSPIPDNWWPVGLEGSIQNRITCMDPELLRVSTPVKDSLLNITFLANHVFKLSDEAVSNVIHRKTTSLLYEVSKVCKFWQEQRKHLTMPKHIPPEYAPTTTLIGPDERFLEVKTGVYYMLERGTVIKFMTTPSDLTDFVLENAFGYGMQGNVKGTVGVIATCPEAFCVEMEFAGVSLQSVINGGINSSLNHPRNSSSSSSSSDSVLPDQQEFIQHHMAPCNTIGALYDVRMLQVTGRLPALLQKTCKIPITDSYSAIGVINVMRERLLDELPFLMAEIINIVTRLSQQGLVNPDIKSNNIVIDGATGQPRMIDFGFILPAGRRDTTREVSSSTESVYSDCPQTAPEYLSGKKCQEAAMTYGLSYMISDVLNTLVSRTGDMGAVRMSDNIPLRAFMAKAYAQNHKDRPRAYSMAPLVGACFPLQDRIAKLFDRPRHTLANN